MAGWVTWGSVVTALCVGSYLSSENSTSQLLRILTELHRVAGDKEKECRRLKVQAMQRCQ